MLPIRRLVSDGIMRPFCFQFAPRDVSILEFSLLISILLSVLLSLNILIQMIQNIWSCLINMKMEIASTWIKGSQLSVVQCNSLDHRNIHSLPEKIRTGIIILIRLSKNPVILYSVHPHDKKYSKPGSYRVAMECKSPFGAEDTKITACLGSSSAVVR